MFQYYFSIFNCFTGVSPPPEILSNQNSRPMESKFFTFVRPYLDYIDSGRFFRQPFCWLYSVLAVLNLLFPLIVLAQSCRLGVFHAGGKVVIAFIIAFLVLALGGWISFQIWWNRKTGSCNRRSKAMIYRDTRLFGFYPDGRRVGRNMDRRCGRFAVVVVVFDFG